MARKTVNLRKNADETVTVKIGTAFEHISLRDKPRGQVFDQVKYAIFSKDMYLHDYEITELTNDAGV